MKPRTLYIFYKLYVDSDRTVDYDYIEEKVYEVTKEIEIPDTKYVIIMNDGDYDVYVKKNEKREITIKAGEKVTLYVGNTNVIKLRTNVGESTTVRIIPQR